MSDRPLFSELQWYKKVLFILAVIILFPLILAGLLIFLIIYFLLFLPRRFWLLLQVKSQWIPKGKFILFVYSNNPEWKEYADKQILPHIAKKTIILNWSEKEQWINNESLETKLFKNFNWGRKSVWVNRRRTGGQNFNHMAFVFKPWYKPRRINFWEAWKEHEFGQDEKLNKTRQHLLVLTA